MQTSLKLLALLVLTQISMLLRLGLCSIELSFGGGLSSCWCLLQPEHIQKVNKKTESNNKILAEQKQLASMRSCQI